MTRRENQPGKTTQTDTSPNAQSRQVPGGGQTKSTGSKPIAKNGLPVRVLPKKAPAPDKPNVRPQPNGPSKRHFHAATSRERAHLVPRTCFALAEGAARLPVSAERGHLDDSAQMATMEQSVRYAFRTPSTKPGRRAAASTPVDPENLDLDAEGTAVGSGTVCARAKSRAVTRIYAAHRKLPCQGPRTGDDPASVALRRLGLLPRRAPSRDKHHEDTIAVEHY